MNLTKSAGVLFSTLLFAGAVTTPALAAEGIQGAPWEFHVNLYGWLPEAPATIDYNGEEIVDVPEDLNTILDSMEMAAMFELEAHKGPLVLFLNNVYYKGDYKQNFTGGISGAERKFELEEEVWAIKYGAGYKFLPFKDSDSSAVAGMSVIPWVGAFYFNDKWETSISPAPPLFDGIDKGGTLKFNAPLVGLVSRGDLSERWYYNLSFGYGGWGVDNAEEVYDFIGNFAYRFTMGGVPAKALIGYRFLHIDYEDGPVELDVDVKGPFLGIGWEF
jgi:hypothetical protein